MKWLSFWLLLFLICLPLGLGSSSALATTSPEDRERLCEWIIHPLGGLHYYHEYICSGRIVQANIGKQAHLHLRGGLLREDGGKINAGLRLMFEWHLQPYNNQEKK